MCRVILMTDPVKDLYHDKLAPGLEQEAKRLGADGKIAVHVVGKLRFMPLDFTSIMKTQFEFVIEDETEPMEDGEFTFSGHCTWENLIRLGKEKWVNVIRGDVGPRNCVQLCN